jgi:hypothetical protein
MEIVRTAGNRQNIPGRRRESGSTMREPGKERDRVSFVYMRRGARHHREATGGCGIEEEGRPHGDQESLMPT